MRNLRNCSYFNIELGNVASCFVLLCASMLLFGGAQTNDFMIKLFFCTSAITDFHLFYCSVACLVSS